ncbi:DNA polymerase IV [Clostridia bacterium]|nr:DNA polymerase IV [Clostridia bacterium]
MDRVIAHSDLDAFYASVEVMLNPDLRGKPVAVCGSVENRHGIILAKSQLAKKAGVKTGQAGWEAKMACPGLILVPPQYDQYCKYSRLVRDIYERYTNVIESYGMDECWLDITGSQLLFGNGEEIARKIQDDVLRELGLGVSVGVAHNKTLAKLASDMNKPKGITILGTDWRDKVWPLPVSDLLFVGSTTTSKLIRRGVYTIGDLAAIPPELMKTWFGKNGLMLSSFANGTDTSRVMPFGYTSAAKSVGHGTTCSADLRTPDEVWLVMLDLAQDIGRRLREHKLDATGVDVCVRGNDLGFQMWQGRLDFPTQSPLYISRRARQLFASHYKWERNVRAVTVRAISLIPHKQSYQLDFLGEMEAMKKRERLEDSVYQLHERFGAGSVFPCSLLKPTPIPTDGRDLVRMPGLYYQ